uniref:Beta-hexosaminidase n=1 Tax=Hirondellea gigas TaxID=1518452 RepID=A0A2P2I7C1_9CRUS
MLHLAAAAAVWLCLMMMGPVEADIPLVVPTKGSVWPKPQMQASEDTYLSISPETFNFTVANKDCPMLRSAMERYLKIMFPEQIKTRSRRHRGSPHSEHYRGDLKSVSLYLMAKCESMPYLHMDEHYEIKINSPDQPGVASIISPSIWGIMYGLESFSQLLVPDGDAYRVNSNQIMDYPRFSYRGFMIDTSRHFLPIPTILENLELMSMNKFNVLHWHIVDAPSFPYQSDVYPNLSAEGAWTELHIYTLADVATVVNYAAERGIRVIPEFDTPGHTTSWGFGQPGLLTECYNSSGVPDGTYGPVDPSNEDNFDFLSKLFTEVTANFPDHFLHIGGDEVPFDCWESSPKINEFMKEEGIPAGDYAALEDYYITRLIELVGDLPTKNGHLVWQEVFDNGVQLPSDTVVHIWKDRDDMDKVKLELANVTAAGFQTLLSSCWYIQVIHYGIDWYPFYECDPQDFEGTDAQKSLIVGGEACMWGEYVDKTNFIPRAWPRASAVGERLWSNPEDTKSTDEATPRLEEHRCRLLARGYNAEPLWPSYCDADIV